MLCVATAALCCAPAATAAGPAPGTRAQDGEVTVLLGLRGDLPGLTRFAARVNDPASPAYRRFRSVEWIAERFGASRDARVAVTGALRRRGARVRVHRTGAFAEATMRVDAAERLLSTRLSRAAGRGGSRVRAVPAGRLPGALRDHVTAVLVEDARHSAGVAGSGRPAGAPRELPQRSGTPRGCAGALASPGFTPNQYARAYGFDRLHRRGLRGERMRIAVVETDGIRRSDLATFARCFGLRMPRVRVVPVNLRGPLSSGAEATLDVEVIMALAPRLSHLDVYEAGGSEADLVRLFAAPLDEPRARRPDVISSSLGNCEAAYGRATVPVFEQVLATAAASGITVVSGSGDTGSSDCAQGGDGRFLAVDYPASSRWVTSVGGTAIRLDAANRLVAETVWNDRPYGTLNAGGGGASVLFRRPAWQRAAGVSGRARLVPDVSFMADLAPGYAIYCTGSDEECRRRGWFRIGGTSASAPLYAAGVALADQAARRRRLPPLGHVNPLLYDLARRAGGSRAPVFRDVRRGDNDLYDRGCCRAGPNFDRASGLGSLDLAAFTDRALRAARRPPFTG